MPPALLDSQLATLEPPGPDEDAFEVDLAGQPSEEAAEVIRRLGLLAEIHRAEIHRAEIHPHLA